MLFDFDNLQSYELAKQKGLNTNFLTWTALRSSVSKEIKSGIPSTVELDPMNFKHNNKLFDTYMIKSKQFYKLLILTKAKLPNM